MVEQNINVTLNMWWDIYKVEQDFYATRKIGGNSSCDKCEVKYKREYCENSTNDNIDLLNMRKKLLKKKKYRNIQTYHVSYKIL